MHTIEQLGREYQKLLNSQKFDARDLDYSLLERHKTFLNHLATVENSGVTVFDLNRQEHVFVSYNFADIFGYDMEELEAVGTEYFNSRVHPEDFPALMQNGIAMLRFAFNVPVEERMNYKLVIEYRMRNAEDRYVRVIEQHQTLELDRKGNIWLTLGVIDLSPNQDSAPAVKSQLVNYRTGKIVTFTGRRDGPTLTEREKEILSLIKEGHPSKEISERLFISIHTVNTHRQRILEKLNADNSLEAVKYASKLGLL